ncbi:hypothetical protein [Aquibacillus kalidii]|uniref:hypothetical protein n=1 Tax=Aquibacillus kalidii TaxID=2762597 RepID=UPI00164812A1|nr:hypothetical protein [Aquibacillus kalidii]
MTQQYLSIEEFNELIQQWHGETIKIYKEELDDKDRTLMTISSISYSNDTRRLDDYEPRHSLMFHGDGNIETADKELQPLPSSYYEIPLEDSTLYQYDGSQLSLITDRGKYTIEVASDL